MDETSTTFRPPHMAFATLVGFLDFLASRPLPPQIDRSIMSSKSGTDQNNLLSALMGFGLIGEQNRVLPALEALATADPEQRKAELATLVRQFYPDAVQNSEDHGTHQQLQDLFNEKYDLGTSADTRRKAITFFLHALQAAGLHVSDNYKKTRSGSGAPGAPRPKRNRSTRKAAANGAAAGAPADTSSTPPAGAAVYSTKVVIGDNTVLTLTAENLNPFALSKADRTFIFMLIDSMQEYEQKQAAAMNSPTLNGAAPADEDEVGAS